MERFEDFIFSLSKGTSPKFSSNIGLVEDVKALKEDSQQKIDEMVSAITNGLSKIQTDLSSLFIDFGSSEISNLDNFFQDVKTDLIQFIESDKVEKDILPLFFKNGFKVIQKFSSICPGNFPSFNRELFNTASKSS